MREIIMALMVNTGLLGQVVLLYFVAVEKYSVCIVVEIISVILIATEQYMEYLDRVRASKRRS